MGFLDGIFGGDKANKKSIDKLVARVREAYAQPEYRREAMEKLLAWSTPESIIGVLARFTVNAQSPHWDEEEKRWLVDELTGLGVPAREALRRFLAKENHIAFAAKALSRMGTKDEYLADLVQALKARSPEDHRTVQGKCELVACLADTDDARVIEVLVPYLDDHGDDVQCGVVDALARLWALVPTEATAPALPKLQAVIADDRRSARVLRHTAAAMNRLQLPIDATRSLAPAVAEDFLVKDGKLAPAH
jgi:hypothetical protein